MEIVLLPSVLCVISATVLVISVMVLPPEMPTVQVPLYFVPLIVRLMFLDADDENIMRLRWDSPDKVLPLLQDLRLEIKSC